MNFTPAQPFFSVVIAWIRLPGLPGYMYKRKILLEIGGIVGSVTKLDLNTDRRTRGRFARMVMYMKETCLNGHLERNAETEAPQIASKLEESKTAHKGSDIEEGPYRPWMLVERKVRRRSRDNKVTGAGNLENSFIGSRFTALFSLDKDTEEFDLKNNGTRGAKNRGKETLENATQWARLNFGKSDSGVRGAQMWKNKSVGIKDAVGPSGKWHELGLGCVGYFDPKEQMKVTHLKRVMEYYRPTD